MPDSYSDHSCGVKCMGAALKYTKAFLFHMLHRRCSAVLNIRK